ncbi:MAG: D-2-hydroxyacid dehydrogenase, partial [Bryobacterales bacterium]|nr:D-2-hydroxyacid dehydrogenase [Bryobacterales bacterium]
PHTPQTEGMFGTELIRQMKPSAYLINIGRGAILKLDDLVDCLREGAIAGAALDVFEQEPLPSEHPLWTMENVLITPHVAGYSTLVPKRHLEVLLENVRRFRSGEPLLNLVRKAEWF